MNTINLEQELIKVRKDKKIEFPPELLEIKEYEKSAKLADDDSLERIGINQVYKTGKEEKSKNDNFKKIVSKINTDRVFHRDEIKAICMKYYLKFLPAHMYIGQVDKNLPARISNYEIAYGVKVQGKDGRSNDCWIVAPKESFKLEARPKDPLFFHHIGNDYWYLVHKWGDDLSKERERKAFWSKLWINALLLLPLPAYGYYRLLRWTIVEQSKGFMDRNFELSTGLTIASVFLGLGFIIFTVCLLAGSTRIVERNEYDSPFES